MGPPAGLCLALDLAIWNVARVQTSAASATFLVNAARLWIGRGAWRLFRERWGVGFWLRRGRVLRGDLQGHFQLGTGGLRATLASLFHTADLFITQRIQE